MADPVLKSPVPMGFAPEQLPPEEDEIDTSGLKAPVVMEPETALDEAKLEFTAATASHALPNETLGESVRRTQRLNDAKKNLHYETLNNELGGKLVRGSLGVDMKEIDLRNDFTRSNEFSEIQAKFHTAFPDGVMQQYPVGDGQFTVIFKRNGSDPFWTEMNPPGLEKGSIGTFMGSVINEKVGLAIAGSMIMPVAGAFIGGAAGSGIQDAIEAARGYQDNTIPQMATHALIEGLIAGTGDVAALVAIKGGQSILGADPSRMFRVNEEAVQLSRQAQQHGLPPLMIAQVAEGDLARYMFSQAAGVGSKFAKNKLSMQQIALMNKLERGAADGGEGFTEQEIATLVGIRARQVAEIAETPATTDAAAGRAMERGYASFEERADEWVQRGYDKAGQFSEITFTLEGAQKAADDLAKGTRSRTADPGAPGGLNRTQRIEGKFPAEFQELLDKIITAKTTVSTITEDGVTFKSFDQMKQWRTQMFDFRFNHSDPNVNRAAAIMWKKLTESMENPMANGTREFQLAWRAASLRYRFKENIAEKSFIASIVRTDTPEVIARKLMVPGNSTGIALTRRIMPEEEWTMVQTAFKAKLMDRGATPSIARAFSKWGRNQRSLNLLISPQERKALLEWEKANARWEGGAGKIILDETRAADEIVDGLLSSNRGVIDDLITNSPGGRNGAQAKSLRAGLYQRLLDGASTRNQSGVEIVDAGTLTKLIADVRKTRKYDAFMTKSDWERLEFIETYAAVIRAGPDVGGEMQRASVAANIKNPTKLGPFIGAWRTIIANKIVGRVLASDVSYDVLKQTGGKTIDARRLRAAAIAANMALFEASQDRFATRRIVGDTGRAQERVNFGNRRIRREPQPLELDIFPPGTP
jgi:hypothetical protein